MRSEALYELAKSRLASAHLGACDVYCMPQTAGDMEPTSHPVYVCLANR